MRFFKRSCCAAGSSRASGTRRRTMSRHAAGNGRRPMRPTPKAPQGGTDQRCADQPDDDDNDSQDNENAHGPHVGESTTEFKLRT